MQRYGVDRLQADRVTQTAFDFFRQLTSQAGDGNQSEALFLQWACRMHETGISVAHSSYHKHSAYILANADMPGFSRRDQARLSRLVLGHRGKLERLQNVPPDEEEWVLIFSLRMAALLHRSRSDSPLPSIEVTRGNRGFQMVFDAEWLAEAPLTAAALTEEQVQWEALGMSLRIKERSAAPAEKNHTP